MRRFHFYRPAKWLKTWEKSVSWPSIKTVMGAMAWIALVCGVAFFYDLAATGLVDETEPLFAEAARQMYETGDWVTPYFNGVPRFDKPPLIYWLMAIGFHGLGVNELAVRLPSALAGAALVGLGFYVLRQYGVSCPAQINAGQTAPGRAIFSDQQHLKWSALIGTAIMALNPETIVWARIGVSDMLLTGCMGTALLSFFMGYAQPQAPQRQRNWYIIAYGLMGLAVLAKGPVGVVLPGLIISVFLLYTGQWRGLFKEMHLLKGAILFLGITVPWYVLVVYANGQTYIDAFFGYHNFDRFTSVVNGHSAPWYFYFVVVFVGFLPWSPWLPYAMAHLAPWRWQQWRRQPRTAHLGIFALIWFGVIFGFFTVAVTKLPSYVLPLMPAAAILIALAWSHPLSAPPAPIRRDVFFTLSYGANLACFALLAVAMLYSPNWMGNDPAMPNLPDLVRASGVMVAGAIIWGLALLFGIGGWVLQRRPWIWSINLAAMVAFTVLTLLPAYQLADTVRQATLRQIAQVAIAPPNETEPLYMVGFMKPSLVFYTQEPVTYIEDPQALPAALEPITETLPVLVVGTQADIANIPWPANQQTTLVATETYQLVRLRHSP